MSEPVTEIQMTQLRRATELLLNLMERRQAAGDITLQRDGFWSMPITSAFDIYSEPPTPTIGLVSESWQNIQAILEDEEQVVGYDLVWLADIFRAIASEMA